MGKPLLPIEIDQLKWVVERLQDLGTRGWAYCCRPAIPGVKCTCMCGELAVTLIHLKTGKRIELRSGTGAHECGRLEDALEAVDKWDERQRIKKLVRECLNEIKEEES